MEDIGIRQLKARASEIVRKVKEGKARYTITQHGRPAALIIPIEETTSAEGDQHAWEDLLQIGQEIGQAWQSDKSSTELLSDSRR